MTVKIKIKIKLLQSYRFIGLKEILIMFFKKQNNFLYILINFKKNTLYLSYQIKVNAFCENYMKNN